MSAATSLQDDESTVKGNLVARDRVMILIPCYQGALAVGEVVKQAGAVSGLPVVVVDDGSSDGSSDAAAAAGALVLRHPKNQGKGAALVTGFVYARKHGFGAVLTLDADGQHDPAEIPSLLEAHRKSPNALVMGVRDFNTGMPERSRTGNRLSTWWISRFAGRPHSDTQSGFRVYPWALFRQTRLRSIRFATETELVLRAAKLRIPLVEVAIRTIYHPEAQTHFHDIADTLRIIRLIATSPLWRFGPDDSSGHES